MAIFPMVLDRNLIYKIRDAYWLYKGRVWRQKYWEDNKLTYTPLICSEDIGLYNEILLAKKYWNLDTEVLTKEEYTKEIIMRELIN